MASTPGLKVEELTPARRPAWNALLETASNATLFHSLDFLAYHPADRFSFRHLLLVAGDRAIAAIPGGIISTPGGNRFRSPLGASVGGPALASGLSASEVIDCVATLKSYARAEGWAGIEIVLAPPAYSHSQETIGFALHSAGFRLDQRWLCGMIDLGGAAPERYRAIYRSRNVTKTRAALRNGVTVRACGREALDKFAVVYRDTYERHGVKPTHSLAELDDLMSRLPDRMLIYLAELDGEPLAGLFVMTMNERVAVSFYICNLNVRAELNANLALFAHAIDDLAARGFKYLDLGPMSMNDGTLNRGVTFFKEGIGARGQCRDQWIWSATESVD